MNTLKKSKGRMSRSYAHSSSRRLFLEGLEGRAVLAGDVFVAQFGGNLIVQGDGDANGVHIQHMDDGVIEVSGIDAGGSPTTINGGDDAFSAKNVRFLTRVHLGGGDDTLLIDHEASASAGTTTGSSDPLANVTADSTSFRGRLTGLFNGIGRGLFNQFGGSGGLATRQHLLINTGAGNDTVDATVDAEINVRVVGNVRGDTISIQPLNDDAADGGADQPGSATAASLTAAATSNVGADLDSSASGVAFSGDVDANANANASAASDANLNAALDAIGNLTAGGIGLNTDLDSAATANLALNSALNSAANLGPSSLFNSDQNLNGSIGGAAALNLVGDGAFDEFGLFNQSSLANINADVAANLALANANHFALNNNAIDDFFASLDDQLDAQADAAVDANADNGLLATLGNNNLAGSGSLNTNINQNLNNFFQSQPGAVPLG